MKMKQQGFRSVRGQYEPAYYLSGDAVKTHAYQSLHSPLATGTTSDALQSWENWNANVEEVLTRPSPPRAASGTGSAANEVTPVRASAGGTVARSLLDSVNRAGSQPRVFAAALESTTCRNGKTSTPKSTKKSRIALYRSAMAYKRAPQATRSGSPALGECECRTPSLVARSTSHSSLESSHTDTVYGSDIFDPSSVEEQVNLLSEESSARTNLLFDYFAAIADIQRELTAFLVHTAVSPREQDTNAQDR